MGSFDDLPPSKVAKRPMWCKIFSVVTCLASLYILKYRGLVDDSTQSNSAKSIAKEQVAAKTLALDEGTKTSTPFAVHIEVDEDATEHQSQYPVKPPATAEVTAVSSLPSRSAFAVHADVDEDVVELLITVGDRVLTLPLKLLPNYSEASVAWMREAASMGCAGELYRSEHLFLIQGRISCAKPPLTRVVKGPCPASAKLDPKRKCFSHDPNCGCHGPIMVKGMVGWAGGGAGPDFFVVTGRGPMTHWAHDHTVFAEVAASTGWATLDELDKLPVRKGGMTMFKEKLSLIVAKSPRKDNALPI